MRFNSPLGYASLAWQSDYGQFYLIDCEDDGFAAPTTITAEMEESGLFVPHAGLVVYTADCLRQHVNVTIYAAEPDPAAVEPMSGRPWTRGAVAAARFPSQRFTLSSPSHPDPLPLGPFFLLASETVAIRVNWMELAGSRDDGVPAEPDVIDIALWPCASSAGSKQGASNRE